MPAPPGVVIAHPVQPGGNTGAGTEDLIRSAHLIFANCGIDIGARRVNRLVQQFKVRVERNGFAFFDFLVNSVQLGEDRRRQALADPDVVRAIAYADHTGETAVRDVMRERLGATT